MSGDSLKQAQAALGFALGRLRPEDSFNIIRFDSQTHSLFPQSVPVSAWTLAEAESYIAGLDANGGTEMLPALQLALASHGSLYPVRQVVFVTDGGSIHSDDDGKTIRFNGNEQLLKAMFAKVATGLGFICLTPDKCQMH